MISESHYWKDPLLKSAGYLRRVRLGEKTSERTLMRIEKELFLGFYSIRKLLDTFTISDSVKQLTFSLTYHLATRRVDHLNWHRLDKNYDLSVRKSETRDIRFLCNRFVHSFVFLTSESEGRLDGFFVASDSDRNSKCYFIELKQVLNVFLTVGKDYPSQIHLTRDENGQWISQVG